LKRAGVVFADIYPALKDGAKRRFAENFSDSLIDGSKKSDFSFTGGRAAEIHLVGYGKAELFRT